MRIPTMPAPAMARFSRRARRWRSWRSAAAPDFAGATQAVGLWREAEARTDRSQPSPGRPCARLGADPNGAARAMSSSRPAITSAKPIPPAPLSSRSPATSSSPRRPLAFPSSAIRERDDEIDKLLASLRLFPDRAHLVGAYSLGKAQRVMALLRAAGYRPADLSAWRDRENHRLLCEPRASSLAICAGRGE